MRRALLLTVVCFLVLSTASMGFAQSSPVGVSLFNPVQFPDQSRSISALRLNFIYAVNQDLSGLDFGLLLPINVLNGDLNGVQLGLYNGVDGNGSGIQWSTFNHSGESFSGWQMGAVNFSSGHTTGLQTGIMNSSDSMGGLQLGLINHTKDLYGVQVGLANINSSPGRFPGSMPVEFFPFFNWSFN